MTPALSIVLICYDMHLQVRRTLTSLAPPWQRDLPADGVEVIVVDNGSTPRPTEAELATPGLEVRLVNWPDPTPSPVAAINHGLSLARAPVIAVMIDGARMASPGLLRAGLDACALHPRPVVATYNHHLGPAPQQISVHEGYDAAAEAALLRSIDWPSGAERLFEISVPATGRGCPGPLVESNALFMPRALWAELGGYEPRFRGPGGGACNADVFTRACALPGAQLIKIAGEATFHQVHGGTITNMDGRAALKTLLLDYARIRRRPLRPVVAPGLVYDARTGDLAPPDPEAAQLPDDWEAEAEAGGSARRPQQGASRPPATALPPAPPLGIAIASYDMLPQLKRTLLSLAPPYQRDLPRAGIEVIVVDNGSPEPPEAADLQLPGLPVRLLHWPKGDRSPVSAMNHALGTLRAPLRMACIDGARLFSPGAVRATIDAAALHPRPVATTYNYHLGHKLQTYAVAEGYTAETEAELLRRIGWPADGYRLFEISVPEGEEGWPSPIFESNTICMPVEMWRELRGFAPGFATAGGGAVAHDTLRRACDLPGARLIKIKGEASFHQVHGGATTNTPDPRVVRSMGREFARLRGHPPKRLRDPATLYDPHARSVTEQT